MKAIVLYYVLSSTVCAYVAIDSVAEKKICSGFVEIRGKSFRFANPHESRFANLRIRPDSSGFANPGESLDARIQVREDSWIRQGFVQISRDSRVFSSLTRLIDPKRRLTQKRGGVSAMFCVEI
jgi:hypothetical protein